MFEDDPSQFQSNIFSFKSKRANLIASYCLVAGLLIGGTMGTLGYFVFHLGMWIKIIPFGFAAGGVLGLAVGYALGRSIDAKRKSKKKKREDF